MLFCQEKACSHSNKDEDRYKQHMENVHGWAHVKHRALNDLDLRDVVVSKSSPLMLDKEELDPTVTTA